MDENREDILAELDKLSDRIDPRLEAVSIILAAGHGKRIKSEKSKMLHEIWGKPSVWRVCSAAVEGLAMVERGDGYRVLSLSGGDR